VAETYSSLGDQRFQRHFTEFRESAYRLESLQAYDVSYERAEFERFLSGEPRGRFPGIEEWADMVREGKRAGKRYQRVHIVIEPLSDYVRFECAWAYRHNVAAGEDVRIIPVKGEEWPEGLPQRDYWLFDSTRLVEMHYNPDASFRSAVFVDDKAQLARANSWRDLAVASSLAFPDYARSFDELMQARRI
jgi:hypothetical protein